jgi:hypothetical protein
MKKLTFMFLAALVIVPIMASATSTTQVPGYKDLNLQRYYQTRIVNNTAFANRFRVVEMSAYAEGLQSTIMAGTHGLSLEQAQLRILDNIAAVVKDPNKRANTLLLANNFYTDPLLMQKYITWSTSSLYSVKCGNATDLAIGLALATGYFSPQDFRVISYDNVHTTSEVRINNSYYVLADFDAGMPAFKNLKSNGQFASRQDLTNNPSLAQQWNYFGGAPNNVGHDLSYYGNIFAAGNPDFSSLPTVTNFGFNQVNTNDWVLCPGCSIDWTHSQPLVSVDIHAPGEYAMLQSLIQDYTCWMTNQDPDCMSRLNQWFTNRGVAMPPLNQVVGVVGFLYGAKQEVYSATELPTFKVVVPPVPYERSIGTDIRIPLLVKSITTQGGQIVVDGVTVNGTYESNLYNMYGPGHPLRTEPQITMRDMVTITSGTIPAGVSVQFTVLYNPGMMSFMRGFTIESLNSLPMTVTRSNSMIQNPTTPVVGVGSNRGLLQRPPLAPGFAPVQIIRNAPLVAPVQYGNTKPVRTQTTKPEPVQKPVHISKPGELQTAVQLPTSQSSRVTSPVTDSKPDTSISKLSK